MSKRGDNFHFEDKTLKKKPEKESSIDLKTLKRKFGEERKSQIMEWKPYNF